MAEPAGYGDRMYADALAVGLAGEHLVCADLLRLGYSPFRTEQAAAYDIAVDTGERIIRLQVKACSEARPFAQVKQRHITGWTWGMRQGKRGIRAYAGSAVDGFALVALDVRRVAYVPHGRVIFQIPADGARRTRRSFDDYPFEGLL